jgi:hypothetical protein
MPLTLEQSLAEPIFFRLLHFSEPSNLELAATAFGHHPALSAKVARYTRVVHLFHNTSRNWRTKNPLIHGSVDEVSRRVAGNLASVLTHVCALEELICFELVTPELLAVMRTASMGPHGHDLLREMDIELHVGGPRALAQLARFKNLCYLNLHYESEMSVPDPGALDGVPSWDMPALRTFVWSADTLDDGAPARWFAFLARCAFPALRAVHWTLYSLYPEDAASAAAFFRAHSHVTRFSMDAERHGIVDIVPHVAVPRLHICGYDLDVYAQLAGLVHPAVRELVLDTSPWAYSRLVDFLDVLEGARPAGLKTVMICFHNHPRLQRFQWVEDPTVAMQSTEQAYVNSFKSDMLHRVQVFKALGIDLADELGSNLLGERCMDLADVD